MVERSQTAEIAMKRRAFLKTSGASALALGSPLTFAEPPSGQVLNTDQWQVISTVQDHLLPSEPDAPGARDIGATAYLDRTLSDPRFDPEVKSFILNGIGWLEEIATEQEKQPFYVIEPALREDLLRQIAGSRAGGNWLAALVSYTLEALLADPLYGGNPGGIGWQWLGHDPGQPRPTPDKIYGRLGRT